MHSCWVSTVSAVVPSRRADSEGSSTVSASRLPGVRAPVADGRVPSAQEAKRVHAPWPDAPGGEKKSGAKGGEAAKVVNQSLIRISQGWYSIYADFPGHGHQADRFTILSGRRVYAIGAGA